MDTFNNIRKRLEELILEKMKRNYETNKNLLESLNKTLIKNISNGFVRLEDLKKQWKCVLYANPDVFQSLIMQLSLENATNTLLSLIEGYGLDGLLAIMNNDTDLEKVAKDLSEKLTTYMKNNLDGGVLELIRKTKTLDNFLTIIVNEAFGSFYFIAHFTYELENGVYNEVPESIVNITLLLNAIHKDLYKALKFNDLNFIECKLFDAIASYKHHTKFCEVLWRIYYYIKDHFEELRKEVVKQEIKESEKHYCCYYIR